jgi:hypothetical protein
LDFPIDGYWELLIAKTLQRNETDHRATGVVLRWQGWWMPPFRNQPYKVRQRDRAQRTGREPKYLFSGLMRDPDTRRRVRRERPKSEWAIRTMPELRIVSDEAWGRVKARQAETHRKSSVIRAALHKNARTGRSPKYLLSGLLKCGICGSNFVMAGAAHYACASRTNGGGYACGNGLRVARRVAESKLLAAIKDYLSAPEYLEEYSAETLPGIAQRAYKNTRAP